MLSNEHASGRTPAPWVCGSVDGELPHGLGTLNKTLNYNHYEMHRRVTVVAGKEVDLDELIRVSQRLRNYHELLRALFSAGEYEQVISLCKCQLKNNLYYGVLALARTLFILGNFAEALEKWEEYAARCASAVNASKVIQAGSHEKRDSGAFDHGLPILEGTKLNRCFLHAKQDCLAALFCLRELFGRNALDAQEEIIKKYPLVYTSVCYKFNGWASALAVLDTQYANEEGFKKLQEKLRKCFRPSTTPEQLLKNYLKYGPAGINEQQQFNRMLSRIYRLWEEGRFREAADLAKEAYENNTFESGFRAYFSTGIYLHSLLLAGDFDAYLQARRIGFGCCWPDLNDPYLNVILLAGDKLRPEDIPYWGENFVASHPQEVYRYISLKLEEFENVYGKDVLRFVVNQHNIAVYPQEEALELLFVLVWRYDNKKGFIPLKRLYPWESDGTIHKALRHSVIKNYLKRIYKISDHPEFLMFKLNLMGKDPREGENFVRKFVGVPPVGKGWISQQEVFVTLQKAFAPLKVLAEASPPFLGGLRYDIYIPELRLAIEYQGVQHFKPVERFGGEEGLRAIKERDAQKARLSALNGITIEYIRYDENIQQRCQEIIEKYRQQAK